MEEHVNHISSTHEEAVQHTQQDESQHLVESTTTIPPMAQREANDQCSLNFEQLLEPPSDYPCHYLISNTFRAPGKFIYAGRPPAYKVVSK